MKNKRMERDAFEGDGTTPYSLESYIDGFNPGLINVTEVKMEGKKIKYSILGDDSTLLKIPMKSAHVHGKAVEVYMEYEVILPNTKV